MKKEKKGNVRWIEGGLIQLIKKITKISLFILVLSILSCSTKVTNKTELKHQLNTILDTWHKNAAKNQYDEYFNTLATNAVFIGTDASENWKKIAFQKFAKPHFDKNKAWNFKMLERNIYFSNNSNIAWFDELLNTWMGVCRGSGVLEKENNSWKIKHYVLSTTIPNDNIKTIIKIKKETDSLFINTFKK